MNPIIPTKKQGTTKRKEGEIFDWNNITTSEMKKQNPANYRPIF